MQEAAPQRYQLCQLAWLNVELLSCLEQLLLPCLPCHCVWQTAQATHCGSCTWPQPLLADTILTQHINEIISCSRRLPKGRMRKTPVCCAKSRHTPGVHLTSSSFGATAGRVRSTRSEPRVAGAQATGISCPGAAEHSIATGRPVQPSKARSRSSRAQAAREALLPPTAPDGLLLWYAPAWL